MDTVSRFTGEVRHGEPLPARRGGVRVGFQAGQSTVSAVWRGAGMVVGWIGGAGYKVVWGIAVGPWRTVRALVSKLDKLINE